MCLRYVNGGFTRGNQGSLTLVVSDIHCLMDTHRYFVLSSVVGAITHPNKDLYFLYGI